MEDKKIYEKYRKKEAEGFELIKQFVEKYPNTKHPTVNDDLIELFMNGARALGFKYIVCVGDETHCPNCNEVTGVVEKKGMSLDTMMGTDSTICHWCYVEDYQDQDMDTPETCDHKKDDDVFHEEWRYEDCMAVLEAFEHSYKAILESESWC